MLDFAPEKQKQKARKRTKATDVDIDTIVGLNEATRVIKKLEKLMREHARNLEFERAATLRDQATELNHPAINCRGWVANESRGFV